MMLVAASDASGDDNEKEVNKDDGADKKAEDSEKKDEDTPEPRFWDAPKLG